MESNNMRELLLLATEQQVHAFDLTDTLRVTLGRHESNEIQLSSRTVSNFHAEIVRDGDGLLLRDLGSTNGTFVGSERVDRRVLVSGDTIRVGNHTLTMQVKATEDTEDGFIRYRREAPSWGPGTKGRVLSLRARAAEAAKTLQVDDPRDLSLPDLLNRLGRSTDTLCAVLEWESESCKVFASKSRIVHAENGASVGEKALFRVFCWQGSTYELKGLPSTSGVPRTISLPTETLVVDGMKEALELGKLVAELPPMEMPLRLKEDCPLPLTAHSHAEIEIFQAIIRFQTIARVVEKSPLTDVRVLKLIESLLRKGVFQVARDEPSPFQETFISPPGAVSPLRAPLSDP